MISSSYIAVAILTFLFLYGVFLALQRLVFSPISHFPGPKLAALTLWYEFYYDVVLKGQYEFKIAKLHEEYGPIVRINPYELHIIDPDYHDTLYFAKNSSTKVDKWGWQSKQFGSPLSSFGTTGHNMHRIRRAAVSPFFSKRAITSLEPFIQEYIDLLKEKLTALKRTGGVVNLIDCFACLTGDIIAEYCFGRSNGFLEAPDFAPDWHQLIHDYGEMGHLFKQCYWVLSFMDSLPTRVAEFMNPQMAELTKLIRLIYRQIDEVLQQHKTGGTAGTATTKGPSHETVFKHILESSELPESEKTVARLDHEARVLMMAGTTTTADSLALIFFKLLQSPDILHRMQDELATAVNSRVLTKNLKLRDLEQLPYLTAIIKEGLRMSHGVVQRNGRIHPESELVFKEWVIPKGAVVSMSTWNLHGNSDIFPEPDTFRPERWLSDDLKTVTKRLDKYLVAFGRGTRQCVGLNLAYAELYLTIATLFGPGKADKSGSSDNQLQFELYETTEDDIRFVRDCFMPGVARGSKGVRVVVT